MYPNENTLLVSISDIKNFGVLDVNIDEHTLLPIVSYIQDEVIYNLIGTRLYEKLLSLVNTGDIVKEENECYKNILDGYLFKIFAWKVKAECCFDLSQKVRNFGVGTVGDDRVYPDGWNEVNKTARYYHDRADKYIAELGVYLRCSCECFPEIKEFTHWWEKRAGEAVNHTEIYFRKRNCNCQYIGHRKGHKYDI